MIKYYNEKKYLCLQDVYNDLIQDAKTETTFHV
jgi:hypothetical protein